jgi:hypothetical protein
MTLLTATSMGLFDAFSELQAGSHAGAVPLTELHAALSSRHGPPLSEDGLSRLCRASVALGLLASPRPDCYEMTPLAATYLVATAPQSLAGYAVHSLHVSGLQTPPPLPAGAHSRVLGPLHDWEPPPGWPVDTPRCSGCVRGVCGLPRFSRCGATHGR